MRLDQAFQANRRTCSIRHGGKSGGDGVATASFIMPQHQYDTGSVQTYGDNGSGSGRNGDCTGSDDTFDIEEPPPVSKKSKKLAVAAGHDSSHRSSDKPAPGSSTSKVTPRTSRV
jgi:hypothetical protein